MPRIFTYQTHKPADKAKKLFFSTGCGIIKKEKAILRERKSDKVRKTGMKFQLIIDREQEETVAVIAHERSLLTDQIENLVLSYGGKDYIMGYSDEGQIRMLFSEIECVTVRERKVYAVASDGRMYRLKYNLLEMERLLPSYFVRINKSAIANQSRVMRLKTTFNGAVDAVFQSGYTDYVSRRCLAEWKRRLKA